MFQDISSRSGVTPDPFARRRSTHRTLWRLHFYAGLFALPFILFLAVTGSIYLFKPDIDRIEEARFVRAGPAGAPIGADAQIAAALAANPEARLAAYRVPLSATDAARIDLDLPGGKKRQVFVAAAAPEITGSLDPDARFTTMVRQLHSELLLGDRGALLTELAASWAFVLILTGLYLWWPAGQGLAGSLWPRLQPATRWRDLHAVTGTWISVFVLVILLTALPWTGVWGEAFKGVRALAGAPAAKFAMKKPDWATSHKHDHGETPAALQKSAGTLPFASIAAKATSHGLVPPLLILPPGIKGPHYVVASDAPSIAARESVFLNPKTGAVEKRDGLHKRNPVSKIVILGIAWHEGQLFGRINQAIGLLTAAGLVLMSVSSFILWRRRRPAGTLGAPLPSTKRTGLLLAILIPAGLLLPMLGASLLLVLLLEQLMRFSQSGRTWLGLRETPA